ncbi:MAG: thioredoxin-disulfide reductase [Muribaculaceae bacterium]|nr:thioredoxin-disulfide reductase [Muribaculaceae bacterium]
METFNFDTIILGAGPAGLSAGIYAARGGVKCAIIDTNMFGGQPSNYLELENYPGYSKIGGFELMEKFETQADSFGIQKFQLQEIESVDLISTPKVIKTKEAEFKSKTVIIATGASPMQLGISGEKEYFGRGVSYCAVCDGAFYKDKTIAVIGGGNSAVEEAAYLTKFASKVYLIHRRDELRADKIIQKRAFNNEKIEIIWDSCVCEIKGNDTVSNIIIKNMKTEKVSEISVDGVFPYIGICPNIEHFSAQLKLDSKGFIITDNTMKTSIEGVYAVGDVRNTPLRQVVTAASDGAIAGVYAVKYIDSLKEIQV